MDVTCVVRIRTAQHAVVEVEALVGDDVDTDARSRPARCDIRVRGTRRYARATCVTIAEIARCRRATVASVIIFFGQ